MASTALSAHAPVLRVTGGLEILSGLWLIAAPFVLNYAANGGSTVNDVLVGLAVLFLGGAQVLSGEESTSTWPSWLNALAGVWLVAAPFALNYATGSVAMWSSVIVGAVIGVSALSNALTTPSDTYQES